jgi:hypothetical protein
MNRSKAYEDAVTAIQRIAGKPVEMTIAGRNAPDQALMCRCIIGGGAEVDPADRHFAGEAMQFPILTIDGSTFGETVIDEEVIDSVEEWVPGDDLELELGDIKIYLSSIRGPERA